MEGAAAWALPAARFIHDAALTLLFGGLLFPAYAFPRGAPAPPSLRTALMIEAWVAVLSAPVVFALTVAGMAGSLAAATDPALLRDTALGGEVGWLFLAREALLAACAIALMSNGARGLALWLSGAALAALALTGHAREGSGPSMLAHIVLDALHLLCAGLWIGALPWFGALIAPGKPPAGAAAAVRRFSSVASWAVAVLILSGAGATLLLVGSPLALGATLWGRLLILKMLLAAAMVALAAHNRWRGTPRLAEGDVAAASRLRANAWLELAFALVVLALVGWIGTLPFEPQG